MQIGNSFLDSIFYKPVAVKTDSVTVDLSAGLQTAEVTDTTHEIAAKFDLRNISPREIDLMAKELRLHQMISDSDVFELLTYGADYLSNQPNSLYSEEMLDTKIDLLGKLEQEIANEKAANNPVEAHKNVLEFIQKMEARSRMPVAGIIA